MRNRVNMKRLRILVLALFAMVLMLTSSAVANAAPSSGTVLNPTCSGVKSTGFVTATGTYQAPNNDNAYKINGYRISLINNGGQQIRTSGLVAVAPTLTYGATFTATLTKTEGNSLKSMKIEFFNGGSVKASATKNCTWS